MSKSSYGIENRPYLGGVISLSVTDNFEEFFIGKTEKILSKISNIVSFD